MEEALLNSKVVEVEIYQLKQALAPWAEVDSPGPYKKFSL